MVMEYYDQIPEDEYAKVFQKGTHPSREEAVKRSADFIRYLNQLH